MIAAIGARTRVLGKDNDLVWRIPADLKRFKELTTGHPIIMGRKTYESIGRPLPDRTNIIITRDTAYAAEGCVVVHSLDEALSYGLRTDDSELFIIGGGQIYEQALPHTDRLYLTLIDDDTPGDVHFPDYSAFTKVVSEEKGEHAGLAYTWITLEK